MGKITNWFKSFSHEEHEPTEYEIYRDKLLALEQRIYVFIGETGQIGAHIGRDFSYHKEWNSYSRKYDRLLSSSAIHIVSGCNGHMIIDSYLTVDGIKNILSILEPDVIKNEADYKERRESVNHIVSRGRGY